MTDSGDAVLDLGTRDRLLVFGGPYGNLAALDALEIEADRHGFAPDEIVCTGDTVAYCADPEETLDRIRQWGIAVVAGNVERQLAAEADDCGCNFPDGSTCDVLAVGWFGHLRRHVRPDHLLWMDRLPDLVRCTVGGLRVVAAHGAPSDVSRFVFASTPWSIKRAELDAVDADVLVAGHCGIPFAHGEGGHLWFNPGVIGMPANDGTPRTWFGVLSAVASGGVAGRIVPLTYDVDDSRARMIEAGLDGPYATSLATGRWPGEEVLPEQERASAGAALHPVEVRLTP
jgi:predicted phosphodiesterase